MGIMPNPPTAVSDAIVHYLIGCQWGRSVSTPDDATLCGKRAVQIVVIHDGDLEAGFKLCAAHRDRILSETTPHAEVGDGR